MKSGPRVFLLGNSCLLINVQLVNVVKAANIKQVGLQLDA